MKTGFAFNRTTSNVRARIGTWWHWGLGLTLVVLCQLVVVPVAISANGASPGEATSGTEGDSKKEAGEFKHDTGESEAPITAPPIVVQGQRIGPEGTGTLNLQEQSRGSSRLGLMLREIPASVEVITQQTME
ncbi:MAG: hypothetical protein ABL983_15155, partial [Nitrospira sp.]